jgi:3-oxoacyl-[acyl-carrier-protein] synthase-3
VLTPGETSLSLETSAARRALDAARMTPSDVELLIVSSLMPDQFGAMNAAYLARDLGMRGMAFNLETACASSMAALHTACGLVTAGQFKNALVVTSCTYSRDTDPSDVLSWTVGDGAGAMVVQSVPDGFGRLGGRSANTGSTCGALWCENYQREDGSLWFRLKSNPWAGRRLGATAEQFLRHCCDGALDDAGVKLEDIDAFVVNTPLAWYADFCARALGADRRRFVDTYPRYANMGPAMLPVNLYASAKTGLKSGDLVLMYAIGSVSSAGAMVLRWGDVTLAPEPSQGDVVCD